MYEDCFELVEISLMSITNAVSFTLKKAENFSKRIRRVCEGV